MPESSAVERPRTETHKNDKTRVSDYIFKVIEPDGGVRRFHMEIQTEKDSTMALRMFEYGVRFALMDKAGLDGDEITVRFPEPVVFYLRGGLKFPKEHIINVSFPSVGQTVRIPVKAHRMEDYTPAELVEKSQYPMFVFSLLKGGDAETLINGVFEGYRKLSEACKAGKIDSHSAQRLLDLSEQVGRQALKEDFADKEEVLKKLSTMDTFTFIDWEATIKRDVAESERRGERRGKTEAAKKTFLESTLPAMFKTYDLYGEMKLKREQKAHYAEMLRECRKFGVSEDEMKACYREYEEKREAEAEEAGEER